MTEKQLLKKMIIRVLLILAVFLAVQIAIEVGEQDRFTDYLDLRTQAQAPENLSVEVEHPEMLSVETCRVEKDRLMMQLNGHQAGVTSLQVQDQSSGEILAETTYAVSGGLEITNLSTGNFTSYEAHTMSIIGLLLALILLLVYGFYQCQKKLGYSYQAIFYVGFFIWLSIITVILIVQLAAGANMLTIYNTLQSMGDYFIMITSPLLLVFAIAISISNISLIRHESFRVQNALGIGISLVLVAGAAIVFLMNAVSVSGSEFQLDCIFLAVSIYTTVYSLMECFLMGSVVCGFLAATHEPAPDKDYIIILGCRVKKDGTLYPLIRGRVDRAIAFHEKQLAKTGKNAVFVPSGGQGSDEQVSEGDAMARYLREQGYAEEQILVENASKNTKENMLFSKALIGEACRKRGQDPSDVKLAFSTTNFHVFRSGIIARQNGMTPEGMGGKTKWYFWPNAYVREMIGMVTYLWKRLVLILIPLILFNGVIQFVF